MLLAFCPGRILPKNMLVESVEPYSAHLNSPSKGGLKISDLYHSDELAPKPSDKPVRSLVLAPTTKEVLVPEPLAVLIKVIIRIATEVPIPESAPDLILIVTVVMELEPRPDPVAVLILYTAETAVEEPRPDPVPVLT